MAEECINLSVTPGKTNSDGRNYSGKPSSPKIGQKVLPRHRRVSIGSCSDGNSQRRYSTGKQISPNTGKNVLPHYLRASTGSCHDFCKYGRKQAVEVKARHTMLKKITAPSSDRQNPTIVSAERKKTTVVKAKPSRESKIHSPEPPEIIKVEVFLPSKKVDISSKKDSSDDNKMKEDEEKIRDLSSKRASSVKSRPVMVKPQSCLGTSVGSNDRRNTNIKIVKKTDTTRASLKKSLAAGAALSSPKSSTSAVIGKNTRKYRTFTMVSPLKDPNNMHKVPSKQSNDEKVQEKVVSLNARKYRSVKVLTSSKDQSRIQRAQSKQFNNDQVQEKTLHVVKAETEDKLLDSVQGGDILSSPLSLSSVSTNPPASSFHEEEAEELSEYTDSEEDDVVTENEETVNMDEVETFEGSNKKMPRKGGVVLHDDKDSAPVKVKFRRGKIVDLQSENNGPRRLRFRRGRVLGENQDNKAVARRRYFKKREVDNDTIDSNLGLEKVALRHQDVQGKKDDKVLFNNVIEETASKLVESRKSKVKALVGAFETVISLQDSKPSTQTVV